MSAYICNAYLSGCSHRKCVPLEYCASYSCPYLHNTYLPTYLPAYIPTYVLIDLKATSPTDRS